MQECTDLVSNPKTFAAARKAVPAAYTIAIFFAGSSSRLAPRSTPGDVANGSNWLYPTKQERSEYKCLGNSCITKGDWLAMTEHLKVFQSDSFLLEKSLDDIGGAATETGVSLTHNELISTLTAIRKRLQQLQDIANEYLNFYPSSLDDAEAQNDFVKKRMELYDRIRPFEITLKCGTLVPLVFPVSPSRLTSLWSGCKYAAAAAQILLPLVADLDDELRNKALGMLKGKNLSKGITAAAPNKIGKNHDNGGHKDVVTRRFVSYARWIQSVTSAEERLVSGIGFRAISLGYRFQSFSDEQKILIAANVSSLEASPASAPFATRGQSQYAKMLTVANCDKVHDIEGFRWLCGGGIGVPIKYNQIQGLLQCDITTGSPLRKRSGHVCEMHSRNLIRGHQQQFFWIGGLRAHLRRVRDADAHGAAFFFDAPGQYDFAQITLRLFFEGGDDDGGVSPRQFFFSQDTNTFFFSDPARADRVPFARVLLNGSIVSVNASEPVGAVSPVPPLPLRILLKVLRLAANALSRTEADAMPCPLHVRLSDGEPHYVVSDGQATGWSILYRPGHLRYVRAINLASNQRVVDDVDQQLVHAQGYEHSLDAKSNFEHQVSRWPHEVSARFRTEYPDGVALIPSETRASIACIQQVAQAQPPVGRLRELRLSELLSDCGHMENFKALRGDFPWIFEAANRVKSLALPKKVRDIHAIGTKEYTMAAYFLHVVWDRIRAGQDDSESFVRFLTRQLPLSKTRCMLPRRFWLRHVCLDLSDPRKLSVEYRNRMEEVRKTAAHANGLVNGVHLDSLTHFLLRRLDAFCVYRDALRAERRRRAHAMVSWGGGARVRSRTIDLLPPLPGSDTSSFPGRPRPPWRTVRSRSSKRTSRPPKR